MFERNKDFSPLPLGQKISMAIVLFAIVFFITVGILAHRANAQTWEQEPAHHEDHSFHNAAGTSCCDNGDLHLINLSSAWKMEKGKYWVNLYGEWFEVPDAATHLDHRLPESVTQGMAAIWFRMEGGMEGGELRSRVHIYCFQPGTEA